MTTEYRIVVSNSAKKSLKKTPLPWREKIGKIIESLKTNPLIGEKLKGELEGKRKITVWPYRIIYEVYKKKLIIHIIAIAHRGGLY